MLEILLSNSSEAVMTAVRQTAASVVVEIPVEAVVRPVAVAVLVLLQLFFERLYCEQYFVQQL